ncbi:hypothetical protein M426DRAFT_27731 [Hypoxylon sp. CI-4A]|nr:hypothetical protein M426DRAFT_27731 [Hypoxylon sp. CI-4A]
MSTTRYESHNDGNWTLIKTRRKQDDIEMIAGQTHRRHRSMWKEAIEASERPRARAAATSDSSPYTTSGTHNAPGPPVVPAYHGKHRAPSKSKTKEKDGYARGGRPTRGRSAEPGTRHAKNGKGKKSKHADEFENVPL